MIILLDLDEKEVVFKSSNKISDNDVLPEKLAYTKDNLYDIICDFIGRLQNKHPEPIKYSINNSIKR